MKAAVRWHSWLSALVVGHCGKAMPAAAAMKVLVCLTLVAETQSPAFGQGASSLAQSIGVVERVLYRCSASYVVHRNLWPGAEDRDFCTVGRNNQIGGEDVSRRDGRQLDVIDVVRQAQWFVAKNSKAIGVDEYKWMMRGLSEDLSGCLSSFSGYRGGWGHSSKSEPDYCEFRADHATSKHYRRGDYPESPNRYSLTEVVAGSVSLLRELRGMMQEWGYE